MKRTLNLLIICLFSLNLFAQQITIKGKVTDKVNGESIPGANILVEGTTTGVITNFDGDYTIVLSNNETVLICSFVGYKPEKKKIDGKD